MRRIPGSHPPNVKNRSSKHLIPLTKSKLSIRSLSEAALVELTKTDGKYGSMQARKELDRRAKKRAKKEAKA